MYHELNKEVQEYSHIKDRENNQVSFITYNRL